MAAPHQLSDEVSQDEGGHDRVAAARFAIALVLVGLHLGGVVTAFRRTDCGTEAVTSGELQELIEALETLLVAKLHQLCRLVGKNNGGHLVLLASSIRPFGCWMARRRSA